MRKNSLSATGLSMSQSQSISNLCNQRAREIEAKLNGINNVSKTISIATKKEVTDRTLQSANPIPENVVDLLKEKAALHACQAFLMENINAKETLFKNIRKGMADTSSVVLPVKADHVSPVVLSIVTEEFGWEQLSVSEMAEYLEAEAFASHIGKFIHQGSTLDKLRLELPILPELEWLTIKDGEKSPVAIKKHHTSEQLLKVHEELAGLHREYEQTVNKFKAKVKNLMTLENARIAKLNADAQNDAQKINNDNQLIYDGLYRAAAETVRSLQSQFEIKRQADIKEVAAMRILVDARFQPTIDMFLSKLTKE